MRARLVVFLLLGVSAVVGLILIRQLILSRGLPREAFMDKKVRLLTYATFVSATGPGPELIKQFQKTCNCKVEVTAVSDAGLLLERLKMSRFDVVIGLDQLMLKAARLNFAWQTLSNESVPWTPTVVEWVGVEFVPIDWSPMSFVYKRKKDDGVPLRFDDLLKPEWSKQIALQDPRASSAGLQFYHWVQTLKGDDSLTFLRQLKNNVHSVSPSWAFAYGLFKKDQVRFVFSYLTSLAYHWGFESDRSYQVLSLPEGHPVQVEFAAVPAHCQQCELGAAFVEHCLQPESQTLIMHKNFMLPALQGLEQGTVFSELPSLKVLKFTEGTDLGDWDQVFGH